MTLISADNTWALWAVIVVSVALSIYLEQRFKWAAKMSALVIVLLLGIVLSNVSVIPADSPVYDTVWDYLVPLALPMLLFHVDIRRIYRECGKLFVAFFLGAAGSVVGAFVAFFVFRKLLPELPGLTAMMTGTYIGGSVNFMALADAFSVSSELVSAATIADNLNMAIYFFVLLSIPVNIKSGANMPKENSSKRKEITLMNLAICLATAFLIVAVSNVIAAGVGGIIPASSTGLSLLNMFLSNKYLWITTVSVVAATAFPKFFGNIVGGQEIGTFMIYCFMFVIGAPASVMGIIKKSPLLLLFAMTIVVFNMIFTFAGGRLLKMEKDVLIIASNANIGGPTTAASMAIAKNWEDLVGPAVLIGSFGYVLGNYLGMVVGYFCSGF